MYVRGGLHSGMSRGMSLGIGHMCVSHSLTNSDTLDSDIDHGRQHSLVMEIEVGDDSTVGPLWLGYYKHKKNTKQLLHVPRAPHLHPQ